jgi:hypothetical protein
VRPWTRNIGRCGAGSARHTFGDQSAAQGLGAADGPGTPGPVAAGPVTEHGRAVLRLAREVELLTADTARELADGPGPVTLTIAVNADSLATWLLPALRRCASTCCSTSIAPTRTTPPLCCATDGGCGRHSCRDASARVHLDTAGNHAFTALPHWPTSSSAVPRRAHGCGLGAAPVVHFDQDDELRGSGYGRRTRGKATRPRTASRRRRASCTRCSPGWAGRCSATSSWPSRRSARRSSCWTREPASTCAALAAVEGAIDLPRAVERGRPDRCTTGTFLSADGLGSIGDGTCPPAGKSPVTPRRCPPASERAPCLTACTRPVHSSETRPSPQRSASTGGARRERRQSFLDCTET